MSMEQNEFSEQQEQSQAPAEELGDAMGGSGEEMIIAEQKQPLNRSTLVVFAVLVLGAGALWFMYRKAGPRSASGAPVAMETAEAKKTISSFLNAGDDGFKSMEARLKNTEKVVQQFLKYPTATQVPLTDLLTNPFRQHPAEAKTDDSAGLSEAAEKKRHEEEKLAIRKAAEGLQLQSIMYSDTRKACMINSKIFREGQSVDDFTIEKITQAGVEVKNGAYRFQLRIER